VNGAEVSLKLRNAPRATAASAVQQSMCHKDIGTTMRYTHEVPTALLETLGKITIKPKPAE
jgi:hypothetical protein